MHYAVLKYRGSMNLGDAIQSFALARLLPGDIANVFRDAETYDPTLELIVNGWHGRALKYVKPPCCYAGIHLCVEKMPHLDWLAASAVPIGTRDPFTQQYLQGREIPSEFVGCVTATLPRYEGPRRGRYSIDGPRNSGLSYRTNYIPPDMSWPEQWALALRRLEEIRTAEIVYTRRLHIAIPCLAFGTPVVLNVPDETDPRFTLLREWQIPFGQRVMKDMEPQSRYYQK